MRPHSLKLTMKKKNTGTCYLQQYRTLRNFIPTNQPSGRWMIKTEFNQEDILTGMNLFWGDVAAKKRSLTFLFTFLTSCF